MTKEITLIGGKFHRKKVAVEDSAVTIKIASDPMFWNRTELAEKISFSERTTENYAQVSTIFGEYDIIPKHIFLWEGLDPVTFLKHLVLDYTR